MPKRRGRQSLNANLMKTTVFFFLESEVSQQPIQSHFSHVNGVFCCGYKQEVLNRVMPQHVQILDAHCLTHGLLFSSTNTLHTW